jgi:hypothetical protein
MFIYIDSCGNAEPVSTKMKPKHATAPVKLELVRRGLPFSDSKVRLAVWDLVDESADLAQRVGYELSTAFGVDAERVKLFDGGFVYDREDGRLLFFLKEGIYAYLSGRGQLKRLAAACAVKGFQWEGWRWLEGLKTGLKCV